MNYDQRLKILEARMTRRVASVHPLHGFMAAACNHPEIGDLMDEVAERFYPAPPADPPMNASTDELMGNLQTLLETGVPL